jgi:hypothetical protein
VTPFVDNPFVRNVEQLRQQFAELEAVDGSDGPHSLLDALYKIATVGQLDEHWRAEDPNRWRARSHVAISFAVIFTSSPYREAMLLPEARGRGFEDVVDAVHANRIVLCIFAPEMECYDRLAAIDRADYCDIPCDGGSSPQEALIQVTSNPESFRALLREVADGMQHEFWREAEIHHELG